MQLIFLALALVMVSTVAQAYVGPGLGLGAIGMLLAVVFSAILAVVGIIWYPLKRLLRSRKKADSASTAPASGSNPANE